MTRNNLILAIKAALKAGEAILQIYQTKFNIETKEDKSPVTEADLAANDIIIKYLKSTGIPIISEESKQTPYSVRKNWDCCWIVDPLDGTKEFINRNGEFTVNIALVVHGIPIIGVIYAPVFQSLYFTSEDGLKAFKIELNNKDLSVDFILKNASEVTCRSFSDSKIRIMVSRSHLNEQTRLFISELKKKREIETISMGSSLKFCLMAEGKATIYPRFSPTMEWDTAAGQAICTAAGVKFIDVDAKQPLKYNKMSLVNPYFLVTLEFLFD